jgi:hypothetical protein
MLLATCTQSANGTLETKHAFQRFAHLDCHLVLAQAEQDDARTTQLRECASSNARCTATRFLAKELNATGHSKELARSLAERSTHPSLSKHLATSMTTANGIRSTPFASTLAPRHRPQLVALLVDVVVFACGKTATAR